MYKVRGKVEKCFDYRFYGDKILVKILGDKPVLNLYDRSLELIWSHDLTARMSNAPIFFKDTVTIFGDGKGRVLDISTGRVLSTNKHLSLFINDNYSASIDVDQPDIIQIKHADGKTIDIPGGLYSTSFHKNYLLRFPYNESQVACFDLRTGEQLWDKPYNSFFNGLRINRTTSDVFINDEVYMYFYDSDKYKNRGTVCIDLRTSSVKQTFEKFGGDFRNYNNRIYTIDNNAICILDLTTKQVEVHDMQSQLTASKLRMYWANFSINDDKLYFIGGLGRPSNQVGIIDLKTFELIWDTTIEVSNGLVGDLKVNKDQLLVYGSDHTLYILDKM